jgi:hypothetical protein
MRSRNAAFQKALSMTSGVPLALDGDLIRYDDSELGATERAAREFGRRIDLSDSDIRHALEQGESIDFERTETVPARVLPRRIRPLMHPQPRRTAAAYCARKPEEHAQAHDRVVRHPCRKALSHVPLTKAIAAPRVADYLNATGCGSLRT